MTSATERANSWESAGSIEEKIANLDERERIIVDRLLSRGLFQGEERAEIDEISLVREYLKAHPDDPEPEAFRTLSTAKAPPVINDYPGCPQIPLADDELPLSCSLDEVLKQRSSRRDFSSLPLASAELATLLCRAYGVRSHIRAYNVRDFPMRTCPTSGGLQAVELYLVAHLVDGVEKGLYHFHPERLSLEQIDRGYMRRKVVQSCTFQEWIGSAPVVLFIVCDTRKLVWKYGRRAYRMVHIDAGIVAENLHLVATALGLSSCMVAGYVDDAINHLLGIDGREEFIALLLVVGHPTVQQ